MVHLAKAPLEAIVVQDAVGAWAEAAPETLNQVIMAVLGRGERLSRLRIPYGRTHSGASIARDRCRLGGDR